MNTEHVYDSKLGVESDTDESVVAVELRPTELNFLRRVAGYWTQGAAERCEEIEDDDHHCEEYQSLQEGIDLARTCLRTLSVPLAAEPIAKMRAGTMPLLREPGSYQNAYELDGDVWCRYRSLTLEDISIASKHVTGEHALNFMLFAGVANLLLEDGETLGDYLDRIRVVEDGGHDALRS